MYRLKELIQLITRGKLNKIDIIDYKLESDTKLAQLYSGVADDHFKSEIDAIESIYPDDECSKNNFSKLKHDLIHRLTNMLFLIDLNKETYNNYQKAYYNSYKEWAAIQIMMGKGARHNAIQSAHKLLKTALKFELTDIAVALYQILRLHYAERLGDAERFDKYNSKYKELRKIADSEEEVEGYYLMIMVRYLQSNNAEETKKEIETLAANYSKIIQPYMEKSTSYKVHLYGYLIELIGYSQGKKYKQAIEVCCRAIDFFSKKDFQAHLPLQIFYYRKMNCQIPLKKYEEGVQDAVKGFQLLTPGSFNWFKYNESYVILCLHTGNYNQAYKIFNQVIENSRYEFLENTAAEIWQIFEAYLYYLIRNDKINVVKSDTISKFRIGRFANSTPQYSKDKRGMNLCIIIIQILLLLHNKKYARVIKKVDAIKQYSYRHLGKEDTYRSNLFIRMLPVLVKQNFHKTAVERHTEKDFKRIKEAPLRESGQTDEIEIIPYEELWKMVLDNLDNNFHYA